MFSPIRLELTTPTPDDRPVFISGNFCDWFPDLDAFRMTPTGSGQYVYEFPSELALPETIAYKYTRGGWDHVELGSRCRLPLSPRLACRSTITALQHWRMAVPL